MADIAEPPSSPLGATDSTDDSDEVDDEDSEMDDWELRHPPLFDPHALCERSSGPPPHLEQKHLVWFISFVCIRLRVRGVQQLQPLRLSAARPPASHPQPARVIQSQGQPASDSVHRPLPGRSLLQEAHPQANPVWPCGGVTGFPEWAARTQF